MIPPGMLARRQSAPRPEPVTVGGSMLNATLRAVGVLLAHGVIDRTTGASMVRHAWVRAAADVLPCGQTDNDHQRQVLAMAEASDYWCAACGIHRASFVGGKCPGCVDDEKRAS